MNRILGIVVIVLLPIAVWSYNSEEEIVAKEKSLQNISLEVPIKESEITDKQEETNQVLVSNNKDKSEAFSLDLEEYIVGVVAGEMPASFQMEALKAQAVAARTYAMYKMKNIDNYVLSTTINDQVYLTDEQMQKKWGDDYLYYLGRVKEAVNSTKGQVITYNGDLIISYYFAISNGYTDNALDVFNENRAYLTSVSSDWDKGFNIYKSSRTISITDFLNRLGLQGTSVLVSNVIRADNNYVRSITINGVKFTGSEVFNKLGLKSRDFTITVSDQVYITTYGFGHGVGMSQYGAEAMAKNNYSYEEILKYYYKDTNIGII